VFDPAAYSPPLAAITRRAGGLPLGVKVGPGIAHSDVPQDAEAQWVSVDGAVVEAGLWFGALRTDPGGAGSGGADGGGHGGPHLTALVIRDGVASALGGDQTPRLRPGPLGGYLYEPDGAVIRASLIQQAAAPLERPRLVSERIAYVTADSALADSVFLTGFEVLDHFDFNLKKLRAYLRARGVGRLTVKKRGTAVDPAGLRKRLDLRGEAEAWLVLTRLDARQSVLVVRPLARGGERS
jgi:hypothetical protein